MCSIMGYCDVCTDIAAFTDGFMETVSRGPDASKIVDTGRGLLGFHRLAIMGLHPEGMQPFELDGSAVVGNGDNGVYVGREQFKPTQKRGKTRSAADYNNL